LETETVELGLSVTRRTDVQTEPFLVKSQPTPLLLQLERIDLTEASLQVGFAGRPGKQFPGSRSLQGRSYLPLLSGGSQESTLGLSEVGFQPVVRSGEFGQIVTVEEAGSIALSDPEEVIAKRPEELRDLGERCFLGETGECLEEGIQLLGHGRSGNGKGGIEDPSDLLEPVFSVTEFLGSIREESQRLSDPFGELSETGVGTVSLQLLAQLGDLRQASGGFDPRQDVRRPAVQRQQIPDPTAQGGHDGIRDASLLLRRPFNVLGLPYPRGEGNGGRLPLVFLGIRERIGH